MILSASEARAAERSALNSYPEDSIGAKVKMHTLINLFASIALCSAPAFAEEQQITSRTLLNVHFLSDGSVAGTDILSSDGHADLAICTFKRQWDRVGHRPKVPPIDHWEKRAIMLSWLPSKPMTCN